jgi:hypothetical protein
MRRALHVLGASGGVASGLSCEYRAQYASTADATTYTFSACDLGAAASDRHIVVTITARAATTGVVSGVTIGGVTATIDHMVGAHGSAVGTGSSVVAIARAAVPTGTTGDVVVTFDATRLRCTLGVFRLTGGTPSVADTGGAANTTTPTVTTLSAGAMTTSAGGVVVAAAANATPALHEWSGVTERYDIALEGFFQSSAADAATTGADVTPAVTLSGATTNGAIAAVTYS